MSLYNMIHGQNPLSGALLALLKLTMADVGRFRDVYLDEDEITHAPLIAVYTRNGGGNREHYSDDAEAGPTCTCTGCTINYRLPKHPLYVRDADDDLDCTYATIWFKVPESAVGMLTRLRELSDQKAPAERWAEFFERLSAPDAASDPEVVRISGVMAPLVKKITDALEKDKSP